MKGLNYFTKFKVIQAIAFLSIPLILWAVNGEILDSVSAYAYHTPMVFALSLTLAGALFVYDGYLERKRWVNIFIGVSLFGVVLFKHLDYPLIHYTCAAIFFLGSLASMVIFSSNKERIFKGMVVVATLFGLSGCFIFEWYSIFWAEWIGMFPISIHFVLEALDKID